MRHPIGMTPTWPDAFNAPVFASPADWISPGPDPDYKEDPPAADGRKVMLADTDHLWGMGGDRAWAWKSFTRGLNVLYMDPWEGRIIPLPPNPDLRASMGYIRSYSERMDLAAMTPSATLASTGYCLADPGAAYLVYLPGVEDRIHTRFVARFLKIVSSWVSRRVDVDLTGARGPLAVEWLNPRTGEIHQSGSVSGGARKRLEAPFGGDAVLYLHRSAAERRP
jgi:hypothetical protein